jgi:hypothetical protein
VRALQTFLWLQAHDPGKASNRVYTAVIDSLGRAGQLEVCLKSFEDVYLSKEDDLLLCQRPCKFYQLRQKISMIHSQRIRVVSHCTCKLVRSDVRRAPCNAFEALLACCPCCGAGRDAGFCILAKADNCPLEDIQMQGFWRPVIKSINRLKLLLKPPSVVQTCSPTCLDRITASTTALLIRMVSQTCSDGRVQSHRQRPLLSASFLSLCST